MDYSNCSALKNAALVESESAALKVPIIENIHQKILEAVSKPDALNMRTWHTCKTTHCRAGWVVTLAGEEGRALEDKTSTLFAALQIYHKSSPNIPVSPVRFYDSNQKAMEDMEHCAKLEAEQ